MAARLSHLIAAASALLSSGCALFEPDRIHYRWAEADAAPCTSCAPAPSDEFVGVAFSGGGSRAAVFAASALEALAGNGMLGEVTHLSSVSGGSIAASYYALRRPSSAEEFDEFQRAMRKNYFVGIEKRQVLNPGRWTSATRRLTSLQDALDDSFLGESTFGDLAGSPALLINAARYDDARRFVFSNLAIADENPGFEPYTEERLRAASFSVGGCARPAPANFPLALGVAISAAFPLFLGPAAFEMPASCEGGGPQYWHLGDGGVIDNMGVETLEEVALRALKKGAGYKRIVIYSFDAGKRATTEYMMAQSNLRLWTRDPARVVDIAAMRAEAYRSLVRNHIAPEIGVPFEIVTLRYIDAKLDAWPTSCDEDDRERPISERLADVPTAFDISSCNADLMEAAAHWLVDKYVRERAGAAAEPMAE